MLGSSPIALRLDLRRNWWAESELLLQFRKHQKRALAKECLKWAHGYMKSNLRVEFGFLFCPERLLEFYESVGWKRVKENVLVDQPRGQIIAPICAMVLELSEAWPSGPIDLDSYPW
jgi:hypothetical protein